KTSSASPLGVKSSPNQLSTKEVVIVSKPSKDTIIDLNSDHVQLKEKLDKVKDFWPGQVDFEPALENGHIDKTSLSQAHGPNVAKVKPQPQHHDLPQQHQQQPTQILQFIPSEVKAAKSIETTFNAFAIPPSQSPNLYQRGNAVFTMGPTSPFRQISSTHQIYPMAYGSNTNDYIQQQQHYGGGQQQHTSSSTINQSFFGGQIQQPQPSRPQSYDGM
uniref:Uncharacterized protein n=1 Tax=Panagrolaimus sp. ES5 TaxID=591445 RepID=A0AC34GJX4_9BILA